MERREKKIGKVKTDQSVPSRRPRANTHLDEESESRGTQEHGSPRWMERAVDRKACSPGGSTDRSKMLEVNELLRIRGHIYSPFAEQKSGSGASRESPSLFQRSFSRSGSKQEGPERLLCC